MSKRQKLLIRIRRNPKNISFADLHNLIERYGFVLKRTKGSHHSFLGKVGGQSVLLVIPYDQPLKTVYVKKALDLIEQIEREASSQED